MSTLPKQFETYLKETLGVSGKTLRNYRADLGHFSRWAQTHLASQYFSVTDLEGLLPHFTGALIATYREHQVVSQVPQSTTNRRLSTLRNLSKFLVHAGFLQHNPAQLISNVKHEPSREEKIQAMVAEFAKHLEEEGVTRTTAKNYLSDVRHFLAWIEKDNKKELPGSLPGSS